MTSAEPVLDGDEGHKGKAESSVVSMEVRGMLLAEGTAGTKSGGGIDKTPAVWAREQGGTGS